MYDRCWRLSVLMVASLLLTCSSSDEESEPEVRPNSVVEFLEAAQRQAETNEQRKEIQRAFEDMLRLSPDELRESRYSDYQGNPDVWSVTTLIMKYYVTDRPLKLDEELFYKDFTDPKARELIEHHLEDVRAAIEAESD